VRRGGGARAGGTPQSDERPSSRCRATLPARSAPQVCGAPGPESPAAPMATGESFPVLSMRRGDVVEAPSVPGMARASAPGHVEAGTDGVVAGGMSAEPLWQVVGGDAPRAVLRGVRHMCPCCRGAGDEMRRAVAAAAAPSADAVAASPALCHAADVNGWTEEELAAYLSLKRSFLSLGLEYWGAAGPWRVDLSVLAAAGVAHGVPPDLVVR